MRRTFSSTSEALGSPDAGLRRTWSDRLRLHPGFATNSLLYNYTTEPLSGQADFTLPKPADKQFAHQNVLAEWRIDAADSNRVDMASRREILRIDQPQFNQNGGTIRFGSDGLLYFGLGDGGGADDRDGQPFLGDVILGHGPNGNGQNIEAPHGSAPPH